MGRWGMNSLIIFFVFFKDKKCVRCYVFILKNRKRSKRRKIRRRRCKSRRDEGRSMTKKSSLSDQHFKIFTDI